MAAWVVQSCTDGMLSRSSASAVVLIGSPAGADFWSAYWWLLKRSFWSVVIASSHALEALQPAGSLSLARQVETFFPND